MHTLNRTIVELKLVGVVVLKDHVTSQSYQSGIETLNLKLN